jgi:hypothetical protein
MSIRYFTNQIRKQTLCKGIDQLMVDRVAALLVVARSPPYSSSTKIGQNYGLIQCPIYLV